MPNRNKKTAQNPICKILGVRYPVLLGAMRQITMSEMAAAISEAGGFGQIAASGLENDVLRAQLTKAMELTDKPVGVNVPVYRPNAFEAIEAAIEMGVKTITTSAGNPAKIMDLAKQGGLSVVHKVSSVRLGKKAADAGVDAVVAMGCEAGGHIGRENITTFCLIPQLVDALDIPVIAAGGIADARGVVAAFALGAKGVEMGTRFVASSECPVPDFFKHGLVKAGCDSTLLLGKDAMPIRVLKNKIAALVAGIDEGEADTAMINSGDAAYVMSGGDKDTAIMPCGQIAGLVNNVDSISRIFADIVFGVKQITRSLEGILSE